MLFENQLGSLCELRLGISKRTEMLQNAIGSS